MRGVCGAGLGMVAAAVVAATAGGTLQVASGDSCTVGGNGTTYTLHITVAPGAPQFGFAFGAGGTTVTKVAIPGVNGNFSAQNLAPNTSGAWVSDTPLTGAPVVTVTTSSSVTGGFTIVPFGASQSAYFSPVRCVLASASSVSPLTFTVDPHVTYSEAAKVWLMAVTIPAGGTVSAAELEPTTGSGSAKSVTEKSSIHVQRVIAKSGGKVTLTLRPTPTGQARLKALGAITVNLHVTFDSASGQAGSKRLVLRLADTRPT